MATMVLILCVFLAVPEVSGSDWPQFMRNSEHNGDAADEQLVMPLNLIAQIKLGDAVMNSPAVVGGLVYVVDQMGKAYCIDPNAEPKIVWESAPEGNGAYGSNTASPCVAGGRVYFGTTAGNVHILDAGNGNLVKTVSFGSSIVSGLTWANDSVYFQTLDAIVYCLDSDGDKRWQWQKAGNIHYGGCVVAVSGTKVVTSIGSNMYCLEDMGTKARLVWSAGDSSTRYVPTSVSISGGYVYTTCPGSDGIGFVRRFSLANGSESVKSDEWAAMCTGAVRGTTMYFSRQAYGVTAYNFGSSRTDWKSFTAKAGDLTPSVTSPALSRNYCVFTTSFGELIAINLASTGSGLDKLSIGPFRFSSPHGQAINSSPAIANGRVYFGCDDGYLYILGSGPAIQPVVEEPLDVHERKSQVTIAGKRAYSWRGAFGDARNAGYVDDAGFKPPFKLRWAVPSYGTFKHPVCTSDEDIVYVTMSGLVVCREQMTGRLRWMTKLADQGWSRQSLLVGENGKIYVPRSLSPRYNKVNNQPNGLYCLDGDTGEILWMRLMGSSNWQRSSPILLDGVVAYGSYRNGPVVHRWDADTGVPLPDITINGGGSYVEGPAGCAGEGLMFFTGGGSGGSKSGETVAIVPATGEIRWRTNHAWGSRTGTPVYQAGKLYLSGAYQQVKFCLDASDGTILWQNTQDLSATLVHAASVGPDYFVVAHKYGNTANRFDLSNGVDTGVNLWGPSHGCGSMVLGSEGLAMSAGINGLCIKDSSTGSILWTSGGFTASTCSHPAVANGRIFYCPQDDGMLYCFEPAVPVNERPGDMDADYDVDMDDFSIFAGFFFDIACPEAAGCWEANLASPGQVGLDDFEAFVGCWLADYCTGSAETAIIYGSDDVEELNSDGDMYADSSDLELVNDSAFHGGDQTIGLRFTDIKFNQGAVVDLAYIQFTAKDDVSGGCSLTIRAEDSDNTLQFGTADFDLTNRPTTAANVLWNPVAWSDGDSGAYQRTPNLAGLVQQVLGRSGWKCGNSLAFVINGTGLRRAWSFDGNTSYAPRLYIAMGAGGVPMVATMPATNITDTSATLNGELTYTGGEDTTVIIYFGDNFGGTNPGNWDDFEDLGVQVVGSFSTEISGLVSGKTYYYRCYAANSNGQTWADSTEIFFAGTPPVDIRVSTDNDDAEERASDGHMYLDSSDLELVYGKAGGHNGQEQIIGIRFQNVTIAPGASISNAYIQFAVDETSSSSCSLTIEGAADDNAVGFTTSAGNISNRSRTGASVSWSPLPWTTTGQAGADQRTSDISAIVAEIVNRSGWSSGNSMVFIITGSTSGTRTAESYKGDSAAAPLLHVEFD